MKNMRWLIPVFVLLALNSYVVATEQGLNIVLEKGNFEGDTCKTTIMARHYSHQCKSKVHLVPGGMFPIYNGELTSEEQDRILVLIDEADFIDLPEKSYINCQ